MVLGKITAGGLLIIIGAGVGIGAIKLVNHERENGSLERIRLTNEVAVVADINGDRNGITSTKEWESVYQEIGVQFDYLHPAVLSQEQLLRYLGNHKDKVLGLGALYGTNWVDHFFPESR